MPDAFDMAIADRERREEKRWQHAGMVLGRAESSETAGGAAVHRVKVILPRVAHGETMVVISAIVDNVPVVGFHRAEGAREALAGALNRLHNGDIKWKEDEYA